MGGFPSDCVFTFSVHDASANNVENLTRLSDIREPKLSG